MRADVPTAMVEAGRRRLHQRQHVMIAAVDAVQEGDAVGGAIGQAQAQRTLVEGGRGLDVAREDQHMRQPARPHRRRFLPRGGAGYAARRRRPYAFALAIGRHFARDLHLDQHAFGIAKPETVAFEAGRRIDQSDALAFDARFQPRQVVGVAAERQMMQRLGLGALHHRAPAVVVPEGLDRQRITVARQIEPEAAVKILRHRRVRHGQHELVERMHAQRIAFGGRRDIAADGGHGRTP